MTDIQFLTKMKCISENTINKYELMKLKNEMSVEQLTHLQSIELDNISHIDSIVKKLEDIKVNDRDNER